MFTHRVIDTIRRHRMIRSGDRILVAVSGGPDSVALTHILCELQQLGTMPSFDMVLAHLNHQLRTDSAEDEAFCARLAKQLGHDFVSKGIDVAGRARSSRRSLEEAGRLARYQFLEATARRLDCTRIALGHTQNDQAETLLLRMLRGAGTAGLASIYPVVQEVFIRPLLDVKRVDLLDFLAKKRIPYRQDPTNQDLTIPRNRVRHEALPLLRKHFNPALVETLARTADLFRDEEYWMEQEASRALSEMISPNELFENEPKETDLTLPVDRLASLHPALARRVIRRLVRTIRGDLRGWSARHVEDILNLTAPGKSGRSLALPGIHAGRSFNHLFFRLVHLNRTDRPADERDESGRLQNKSIRDEGGLRAQDGYNGYEYEYVLPVPGCLEIPEAGGVIQSEESTSIDAPLPAARGNKVVVAVADEVDRDIDTALTVRNSRPGDKFRPFGAPGTKSLSRYLMEHRVERQRRGQIPLVVQGDEVLWVVGHGISELSRVGSDAHRKLRLSWVEE